jgi:hypothetical protein
MTTAGAALLAAAMLAGCKQGPTPEQVAQTQRARAQEVADSPCPPDGLWKACSLTYRLYRAGLGVRLDSVPATDSATGKPGLLYHIGHATLAAYVFATEADRKAAVARMDTSAFIGYMSTQIYPPRTSMLQSANLLALMVSQNDEQRQRIGDAIMAGPPQAPKK